MHELDVTFAINEGKISTVYAYCHQHDIDGEFMVNHYLKITGNGLVLKAHVDDESDVFVHCAYIEKLSDSTYEIYGVGDCLQFKINGELHVTELPEDEFDAIWYGENKL